ncbi:MAG TPA: MFS transporter [Actinophytocola sp.]|uniref:MFS transporter n=1 Tax=Actinophytocola sp. TaxID=1872138 RepID=UPI002DBB63DB|nr:MFS transporter [Actinophytocola sp.]HEU5472904.1 MFS transporter [Actinophytocola sp.]
MLGATAAGSFGAGVGRTAVPLLAVTALGATPFEVGVLLAAQTIAFVVIGLPAGAVVDRVRKRRTMIAMDLLRMGLGAVLLLLWWAGLLGVGALIVLVALIGCASVFFDVAALAYLTQLVGRHRLGPANGGLQGVSSATSVGAPVAAGGAAALVGAAATTAGVALGYAVSAVLLGRIRHREPPPEARPWRSVWADTGRGLRCAVGTPTMRGLALCTAGVNVALSARAAVLVIFLLELGFGPTEIGIATAASGAGGVLAALGPGRVAPANLWWLLVWTQALGALVPLAAGPGALTLVCLGMAVSSYGATRYNLAQLTTGQLASPPGMLGAVSASNRFLVWATLPVGGLLGGALGCVLPVTGVLWVTTALQVAAILPLVRLRGHTRSAPWNDPP